MEKFSLNHLTLYSKNWYKSYHPKSNRKTIWDDMQILLELDGYTMCEDTPNKHRIVKLILSQCQRLKEIKAFSDLYEFYNGIQENECWRYGYYTKGNCFRNDTSNFPNYDISEAVIIYCLSNLRMLETQYWKPCLPNYSKLPRPNGITNKKLKEFFGNEKNN